MEVTFQQLPEGLKPYLYYLQDGMKFYRISDTEYHTVKEGRRDRHKLGGPDAGSLAGVWYLDNKPEERGDWFF